MHTERYLVRALNFWRDILPPELTQSLTGRQSGEKLSFRFREGQACPRYDPGMEFDIEDWQFDRRVINGQALQPRFGRFYPKGLLKALPQVFSDNTEPFRYIMRKPDRPGADFNHPLALAEIELDALVRDVRKKAGELGGTCTEWLQVVTEGPGMQARWKGAETDFFSDTPFGRAENTKDALFYNTPRLTTHTDDQATRHIEDIYGSILSPDSRVLDLMSSWRSHIAEALGLSALIGLGMNREELEDNPQLTRNVVHDLNERPRLPFGNSEFDAVVCTVSVEYMTQPFEVFAEVLRILSPGGTFVVTFSNRWFPPKVVRVWTELHEFERMGLVIEYFLRTGGYTDLETCSIRGWPRPVDDRYYPGVRTSDPVYAVWGRKSGSPRRPT